MSRSPAMSENIGRVFGGFAALAVLWIVVYWWWQPTQRISFDPSPAAAAPSTREPPPTVVSQSPSRPAAIEPAPPPPAPVVEPTKPAAGQEPPRVAVVPPQFRQYTVKARDTLASIAERELGSAKYAEAISRANPLADLERLKPGRVINIPLDPKNIQGKPVAEAPAAPAPAPAAATQVTEYTVKPGDTLSEIAKALYGSISYKDALYEANKDRLESEDALKVGQKLRVPPKK